MYKDDFEIVACDVRQVAPGLSVVLTVVLESDMATTSVAEKRRSVRTTVWMFSVGSMSSGGLVWLVALVALAAVLQCSAAGRTQRYSLDIEERDVLTMSGDAFVYHTTEHLSATGHDTEIKLTFQTSHADSVLLYANGGETHSQFLLVTVSAGGHLRVRTEAESVISNGNLRLMPDLHVSDQPRPTPPAEAGEGSGYIDEDDEDTIAEDDLSSRYKRQSPAEDLMGATVVNDGQWHSLHISLEDAVPFAVRLDDHSTSLPVVVKRENNTRHFSSYYFGQIPVVNYESSLVLEPGDACCSASHRLSAPWTDPPPTCMEPCHLKDLQAQRPFIGCIKEVAVNGLDLLSQAEGSTEFIWTGGPRNEVIEKDILLKDDCAEVGPVLSLNSPYSHVSLPLAAATSDFSLEVTFRQRETGDGVLANGLLETDGQESLWQLYCEGNHLYFKSELVDMELSHNVHEAGSWNTVRLWLTGDTLFLSVNGISNNLKGSFKFLKEVTIGEKSKALVACLKDVNLFESLVDLRKLVDRSRGVVLDRCESRPSAPWCGRGEVKPGAGGEGLECECEAGYDGSACQFAQYPPSCAAYRQRGYTQSGLYALLLAGEPVTVECCFGAASTITEFGHNLPHSYDFDEIAAQSTTVFNISYGERASLQHLMHWATANSCQQRLVLDCSAGQGGGDMENVMIASPSRNFSNITDPNALKICNCDAAEACSSNSAECGTLGGPLQPGTVMVTAPELLPIAALQLQGSAHSHLSLSPMMCSHTVAPSATVSLQEDSFVKLTTTVGATITFSLRTGRQSALLLRAVPGQGHQEMLLIMRDGNALETRLSTPAAVHTDELHFDYLLNTGNWQYFLVTFAQDQIKLMVNGHTHFISTRTFSPGGEGGNIDIFLGGSPRTNTSCTVPGLRGCLTSITVNSEPLELPYDGPHELGCEEACARKPCSNGAECRDLLPGGYECDCKHPFTGPTCDHDTSSSAMSFLTERSELYWSKASDPQESNRNPMTNDTSFIFKTREGKARLLFSYDHLQNLLNVHLSKPNEIYVIWNSGYILKHATINTEQLELNTSRAVRVSVARTPSATQVAVSVGEQEFRETVEGAMELIVDYQQESFNGEQLFDLLPHYPQPVTAPAAFLSVHLGGAELSRRSETMPGLVGCMDSFTVNGGDVPLPDTQMWLTRDQVLPGCRHSCASEPPCAHGGVCLDQLVTDHDHPRCDCTNTGYGGADCRDEVSFSFGGSDHISVTHLDPALDLELSFGVERTLAARTELLFLWHGEHLQAGMAVEGAERLMVWGGPEGAVRQAVLHPEQLQARLALGARHRTRVTVGQDGIILEFDGRAIPLKMSSPVEAPPGLQSRLSIGGSEQNVSIGAEGILGFTGCISNVKVVGSSGLVFFPLEAYQKTLQGTAPSLKLLGAINVTATDRCSAPAPPLLIGVGRATGPQGGVHGWQLPTLQVSSEGRVTWESEPDQPYTVLIVCAVLAAILLIAAIIAAALWCWRRSKLADEQCRTGPQPTTTGGTSYRRSTPPAQSLSEFGLLSPANPHLPAFLPRSPTDSVPSEHSLAHETLLMTAPAGRGENENNATRAADGCAQHTGQTEQYGENIPTSPSVHFKDETGPSRGIDNPPVFNEASYRVSNPNSTTIQFADKDGDTGHGIEVNPKRCGFSESGGVFPSHEGGRLDDSSNSLHDSHDEISLEGNQSDHHPSDNQTTALLSSYSQNTAEKLGNRFQEYVPRENPPEEIPLMDRNPSSHSLTSASQPNCRIVGVKLLGEQLQRSETSADADEIPQQPCQERAILPEDDGVNEPLLQLTSSDSDSQLSGQSAQLDPVSAAEDSLSASGSLSSEEDDMFQAEESSLVQPAPVVYKAQIISRTQSDAPSY